jgi:LysM repeat protein
MIDGLDKLAEIEVLREAAQRPPAEVQRMQMPSPQAGLQSLGQQEVDMGTGMPVGFSPVDAVGQITNIAGQYALANPQKTGPFAAALAAFGAGSEAANMIDKRIEAESERENLADVKSMAGSLPDRTRTVIPTMDMPVQAQEEIQISEVAPQAGLASMMPMSEGGSLGQLDNKSLENLRKAMLIRESSGNYSAINQLGYVGGYQFGAQALETLGYLKKGSSKKGNKAIKDSKNWTGKGNVKNLNQFFANEKLQDKLFKDNAKFNYRQLKNNSYLFPSSSKEHVSGMLAASHLLGAGGAMDNLESEDANAVSGVKYYNLGKQSVSGNKAQKEDVVPPRPRMKPMTPSENLEKLALLEQTAIETSPKAESKDTDFIGSAREAGKGLLNLLGRDYTVKGGDTLSSIAKQSGVSVEDLLESNPNIVDRDKIAIGQEVDVPNMKSFVGQFENAFGLQEGGDVGEYFEGQVEGKGDGMSDEIPFRVKGGNPDFALLSKDEYVIPADVVSMLGNGSSDAGANKLDDFLTDVRKEAFGREKQQKEIDAEKGLSSIA